jgi:hypothetical protein
MGLAMGIMVRSYVEERACDNTSVDVRQSLSLSTTKSRTSATLITILLPLAMFNFWRIVDWIVEKLWRRRVSEDRPRWTDLIGRESFAAMSGSGTSTIRVLI